LPHVPVVLEPAAQALADATDEPPYLCDLGVDRGRRVLDKLQSGTIDKPAVEIEDTSVPDGPRGDVSIRIIRPHESAERLPVILYTHGAGWVYGSTHTHDRLVRELVAGTGAAVVFPNYSLSPEARYPTAVEEVYTVLEWLAGHGAEAQLDASRIAVAGDAVGGNMTAAITLMAKRRLGPRLAAQVLFYPVTDADFHTPSYRRFAEGYFLRRDAMQWLWDQYTTYDSERSEVLASPLRAGIGDLAGLPRALVITAEADVLRDEGEAYARKLRRAGVEVTAVRYQGTIHGFVMLDALRATQAAHAAIAQAITFLRTALT
jgi:acetyl esterase/lipase